MASKLRFFLASLILTVVFTFSFYSNSLAQEESEDTEFEKAYKDYESQITEYNTAHSEYVLRRSQYLRFRTLQSQQDAYDATRKMLVERDDVDISYLNPLKERLKEAIGVEELVKQSLYVRIDGEIGWLEDHQALIPSAGTLEDLVADSNRARNRFASEEQLFYEASATVSAGKYFDLDERLNDLFTELKEKIVEVKAAQDEEYRFTDEKLNQLDRWVFDAETRMQRADQKYLDAQKAIGTLITKKNQVSITYNSILLRLGEAQQFLRDSGSYMIEIVRSIKTAED